MRGVSTTETGVPNRPGPDDGSGCPASTSCGGPFFHPFLARFSMRTHAPPLVRILMAVAADLRAAGNSWETIALRLKRTVATVRGWPARYVGDWGRLYRAAEQRQL